MQTKDEILTRLFKEGHINLEEFRALDIPIKIEYKYIEKCTCNCNKTLQYPNWITNPVTPVNPYQHPFIVTCGHSSGQISTGTVGNSTCAVFTYPTNTNINHTNG